MSVYFECFINLMLSLIENLMSIDTKTMLQ